MYFLRCCEQSLVCSTLSSAHLLSYCMCSVCYTAFGCYCNVSVSVVLKVRVSRSSSWASSTNTREPNYPLALPLTSAQITVFESNYASAVHFYMSYSIKLIKLFHVSLIIVLHECACARTETGHRVCGTENLIALIDFENVSDPLLL